MSIWAPDNEPLSAQRPDEPECRVCGTDCGPFYAEAGTLICADCVADVEESA